MAVKSLEGCTLNTLCQGKPLLDFQIPSTGWSSILHITPLDFQLREVSESLKCVAGTHHYHLALLS